MRYINFILILLLSCAIPVSAIADQIATLSANIEGIVGKIAEKNVYHSAGVGVGAAETEQWKNFQVLKQLAGNEELILLTDHENAAVRTYSFQALAERNHPMTYTILKQHITDNQVLETFIGCIISRTNVSDFFLDIVNPEYKFLQGYKLTQKQQTEINHTLLYNPQVSKFSRDRMLKKIKPDNANYHRIKQIFTVENNPSALIALARYRNQDEKNLIIHWLTKTEVHDQSYGLSAVRYFPDPVFFPYLEKIHRRELRKSTAFNSAVIDNLYLAIVQFQTTASRNLLQTTLTIADESTLRYHSRAMWLALKKFPHHVFDGINDQIKLSESDRMILNSELQYHDY